MSKVKLGRPDYVRQRQPAVCVHVIEVVTDGHNMREVEDVLEQLRQYSAAAVVERFAAEGTFDAVSAIMNKRALPDG
jgi:hypothetical protein